MVAQPLDPQTSARAGSDPFEDSPPSLGEAGALTRPGTSRPNAAGAEQSPPEEEPRQEMQEAEHTRVQEEESVEVKAGAAHRLFGAPYWLEATGPNAVGCSRARQRKHAESCLVQESRHILRCYRKTKLSFG